MSKLPTSFALVLGALLLVGCAGDDTVNPLPPPDASTDASKDATATDGASAHDAADAGEKDATATDAASAHDAADAGARDAGDKDATADASTAEAGPDAAATDATPDGD